MQKFGYFLICMLLLVSVVSEASPFDETTQINIEKSGYGAATLTGTVNTKGYGLNVRTGPWGTIVGSLKDKSKVKIVGSSGDWYKISYGGKTRYVHKDYVSASSAAKTSSSKTGRVKTGGPGLNVRTGPWGAVVGTLSNNAAVKIVGSSGDWYKISYGGKTRYVHKNYVSTATSTASQKTPAKTSTAYVNTNGVNLNVRTGPWGSIVGSLKDGSKVKIVGSSGDWYKISYGGKTRYVHKNYVSSKKSGSSGSSGSTSSTYKASVIGKPSGDGTVAGALTWARDQINGTKKGYNPNTGQTSRNSKAWSGWCLAFVNSSYGRKKSVLMAYSAIKSYYKCKAAGKIRTTRNPPAGAAMYTGTLPGNPYGHVFIATGKMAGPNDPIIITTTSNGIKEMPMSRMGGGAYLGWAMP